jgi:hypothetical protein
MMTNDLGEKLAHQGGRRRWDSDVAKAAFEDCMSDLEKLGELRGVLYPVDKNGNLHYSSGQKECFLCRRTYHGIIGVCTRCYSMGKQDYSDIFNSQNRN